VFTYSERPNTLASTFEESVPSNERADRSKMLHILSEKKRRKFYEDCIGQTRNVLFENDVVDGNMFGFTENYVRVSAKYDPLLINEIKKVKLVGIGNDNLMEVTEAEEEILTHG
jgi:threonylcarbamoyladenosine tRNA methylthiotransferase MtaB